MLQLTLLWLLIGLIIGLVGIGSRFWPPAWGKRIWLILPVTGIVAALIGGWLSTLLLGQLTATASALWVSVLCVVIVSLGGRIITNRTRS